MLGRERRLRDAAGGEHEAEEAGLDRRPGDSLGERPRTGGGRRVAHAASGLRRMSEPQEPGQRAGDDLADRMLEVAAGPDEQLQRRRIEQRLGVDDGAHPLEPRRIHRARRGDADHHPDDGGAPERHPDPHAGPDRRRPSRSRGQVVEPAPDRRRHRHLEDGLGHRVTPPPSEQLLGHRRGAGFAPGCMFREP